MALTSQVPSPRYAHLRPILESGQDKTGLITTLTDHDSAGCVRGPDYYAGEAKCPARYRHAPQTARNGRGTTLGDPAAQDDTLTLGMSFEQRISLAVDEAHTAFTPRQSRRTHPQGPAALSQR